MQNFHLPPTGYGPGSQTSEDGAELEYMSMPQDMRTYTMHLPEMMDAPTEALDALLAFAEACERVAAGGAAQRFDLSALSPSARRLLSETLGEGEVAMKIRDIPAIRVQESVFAGVWCLTGEGLDMVEVAPAPSAAITRAAAPFRAPGDARPGPGVINAPALLSELLDHSARGTQLHVINLSLLPHTEEDLAWLGSRLGEGSVDILSRGYGNCRITSTALPRCWHVQFFNSTDQLILDTYEITAMPQVVLAAHEDLADSAERLREVVEAIR
ncbi:hydrogenase expression/formation protein [Pseudooceanicola sp. CBS1P-1]|uniref:Hydrogenase expression/formation protein n=1 Tax=Pseudooceanicola albus TaxID=2692189 RepID=A0A6L7G8G6_9RHOB|nr:MULTISPECIES: hydrogenase expression/formation protein [Pseudooceanicola]MBT9384205.1 hydrogenase expression/formation protein [Pseudooceanicola endophyticus]MXN19696.1 hydrogenase expression/formation protein [Pseudooceanicola albus]